MIQKWLQGKKERKKKTSSNKNRKYLSEKKVIGESIKFYLSSDSVRIIHKKQYPLKRLEMKPSYPQMLKKKLTRRISQCDTIKMKEWLLYENETVFIPISGNSPEWIQAFSSHEGENKNRIYYESVYVIYWYYYGKFICILLSDIRLFTLPLT